MDQDDAFWQSAYHSHAPAVLAYLLRRVRRKAEAEDLLQETFMRAMRVDSFRRNSNLRAYLLSTARNLWINQIRRPRVVVPDEGREDRQPFADVVGQTACPDRDAAWVLFRGKLDSVLTEMIADHRKAFEMAVFDQMSYDEISRATGWSLPRVKTNVFRARRKLVEQLGDHIPDMRGERP